MKKSELLPLLAILILASILRLWGLNHQIYTDENKVIGPSALLARAEQEPLLYPGGSRYPHLYQNTLAVAFLPLSLQDIPYPNPTPDVDAYTLTARIASAFFGIGAVAMTFVVGRQLVNTHTGLIAALFMAVIPLHVKYSHYAHVEMPLTFMTLLTLWAALRLTQSGQTKWYITTGALVGASSATNYTGLFTGIVLLIAHGLRLARATTFAWRSLFSKSFIFSLLAIPLFFALGSPYTLIKWEKSWEIYQNLSKRGAAGDIGHTRPNILWPIYNNSKDWSVPFTSASLTHEFGLVLLLLAAGGLAGAIYRRHWQVAFMLGATVVVMYVAIVGQLPLYAVKRLLPLAPLITILAAYGLDVLPSRLVAVAVIAAIVVPNIWHDLGFSVAFAGGSTHSTALAWAVDNLPHGSAVLQHTPIRLLNWDDPRFTTVRLDEVYASFNKDDPEAAHDRAKPIEWWITEKGVDFVAMDSRLVDRYYDATSIKLFPETTASYQAFYNDIRARGTLVFKIEPEPFKIAGPRIEIYDVRDLAPSSHNPR